MATPTQETADWWSRSRGEGATNWIAQYQTSTQKRHRTMLVEILKQIQPESLLEIGAHCGPNLMRFAETFPTLAMHGIDASGEAIAAGRAWVKGRGLEARIGLSHGRIPEALLSWPSGVSDVVLSCYTLAYIAPADLDAVLYEVGRIATKAIVLAEPLTRQGPTPQSVRSLTGYNEWAHNFDAASRWSGTWRGWTLTTIPVDPPVDRLNGIIVATRDGSTPSAASTP